MARSLPHGLTPDDLEAFSLYVDLTTAGGTSFPVGVRTSTLAANFVLLRELACSPEKLLTVWWGYLYGMYGHSSVESNQ